MRVDVFDFNLPPDCIALEPVRPRDAARLLYVDGVALSDRRVCDLPEMLRPGDLLVLNDTKVIRAQLRGRRTARREGDDVIIDTTLHKRVGAGVWRAFARPAKRLRVGDELIFSDALNATVEAREGAEAVLRFNQRGEEFDAALESAGAPPLPPYIARRRAQRDSDTRDYQTVFATEPGSVAAPTAGLHFTSRLFDALDQKGALRETITLHVGAGTFLPVSVDDTRDHKMHAEWGEMTERQADAINRARAGGGRIIAVGTTALRLLESASDEKGGVKPFAGETDIFITPGYRFKAVDALLTNFHLPRSTLFMLVCAFAGVQTMKAAYAHAIASRYRFYSFGDACFLERGDVG